MYLYGRLCKCVPQKIFYCQVANGSENLQYRLLHVYPDTFVKAKKTSPKTAPSTSTEETKTLPTQKFKTRRTNDKPCPPTKRSRRNETRCISTSLPTGERFYHSDLSEEDICAVFDSVHHNRKPPPHLTYQVIHVNSGEVTPPRLVFQGMCAALDSP